MAFFKSRFFLKIVSLVFAVFVYVYIHHEIRGAERKAPDPSYKLIKLTAKTLPVKVRLETVPPEGYRIVMEKVTVDPKEVVVIGPEALLENALSAETAIVDVSESTKTAVRRIPLESAAGIHLAGEYFSVNVTVPIEKIAPDISAMPAAPTDASEPPASAGIS